MSETQPKQTMSSPFSQPPLTQPRTTHRHPSRTRYYAHRVQESLTSRIARFFCSIFLFLLLLVGIIIFILWLSLRPHRPRFYLNSFSLAQPSTPAQFNVSDRNPNQKIGIYYYNMNGSVYYGNDVIASGPIMLPFYQPPKNTTVISGTLGATGSGSVASQYSAELAAGRVGLRLELVSIIRFKVKTWDTHHHRLHVDCDLVLGSNGNLLPESINEKCSIYF